LVGKQIENYSQPVVTSLNLDRAATFMVGICSSNEVLTNQKQY